MNLTFNTEIATNVSVVLDALNFYQKRQFKEAIEPLMNVLDMEPRNWDARLMLAACYYKTEQYGAAERAFRMIYDNAADIEMRNKAGQGLRAVAHKFHRRTHDLPPEFGCNADRFTTVEVPWLA